MRTCVPTIDARPARRWDRSLYTYYDLYIVYLYSTFIRYTIRVLAVCAVIISCRVYAFITVISNEKSGANVRQSGNGRVKPNFFARLHAHTYTIYYIGMPYARRPTEYGCYRARGGNNGPIGYMCFFFFTCTYTTRGRLYKRTRTAASGKKTLYMYSRCRAAAVLFLFFIFRRRSSDVIAVVVVVVYSHSRARQVYRTAIYRQTQYIFGRYILYWHAFRFDRRARFTRTSFRRLNARRARASTIAISFFRGEIVPLSLLDVTAARSFS